MALDDFRGLSSIWWHEHILLLQNLTNLRIVLRDNFLRNDFRASQVIVSLTADVGEVFLHRLRGHQGEEGIDAVVVIVAGEGACEKAAECAAKTKGVGVALAVCEAPGGHVVRCVVIRVEPVAASQGDGIAENSATDCVACDKRLELYRNLRWGWMETYLGKDRRRP